MNEHDWGGWVLDRTNATIYFPENGYYVDLERCRDSAQVLDWIFQIRAKMWATPEVLAGLLNAINDVMRPQQNLCSSGVPRSLSTDQIWLMVSNTR